MFNLEVGSSLPTYLLHLRIEEASRALVTTKDTVSAISRRCGFSSPGYFCRRFRQEVAPLRRNTGQSTSPDEGTSEPPTHKKIRRQLADKKMDNQHRDFHILRDRRICDGPSEI